MLHEITAQHISELTIDTNKPLVICDVDEVVLHFVRGLENYLETQGLWLDPASFALNGNIKEIASNTPIENSRVGPLLKHFFATCVGSLDAIEGAADALDELSDSADVVMLTNMPHDYRDARIENLHGHGMPYPVVSNTGSKGAAIHALASEVTKPVFFLDDTPDNLHSSADTCPDVINIHFIQDDRFGRHLTVIDRFSLRTNNWNESQIFMRKHLEHHG
ncbi:MAG: hypothetical protein ACR2OJ_08190 [Hyphomicrobiales bacterium]